MSDQLCTTAAVKARIGIAVADVTDDTLISELIDQVSGWVEGFTHRKLVPETAATYVFDTVASTALRIDRGIRTVSSMGVASTHQPDSGGSYTNVPVGDVILRPKPVDSPEGWPSFEVRFSRGTRSGTLSTFSRADNGCTITGNFGFAATPVEITSLTIDAVVIAYQSRKNGASGAIGDEGYQVTPWSALFGRGSPQRATLERYRAPAV
jgi:hypothetical protein